MRSIGQVLFLAAVAVLCLGASAQVEDEHRRGADDVSLDGGDDYESPNNELNFIRVFAGRYYQNTYKQINEYLMEHLKSKDAQENMKLALDWLNDEKKRPSLFNQHFIEGLTQFTSLSKINHRCDQVSHAILIKNDRATNHVARTPRRPEILHRIENIIYNYALNHTRECESIYPERLRQKLAAMDKNQVKEVEQLFKNVEREVRGGDTLYELIGYLSRDDPDNKYLRKILLETTGKFEVNKAKLEKLIESHVASKRPFCQYYVGELGSEIFEPNAYDLLMYPYEDRKVHDDEYALAWRRYKLCKILLKKNEDLVQKLTNIIQPHAFDL